MWKQKTRLASIPSFHMCSGQTQITQNIIQGRSISFPLIYDSSNKLAKNIYNQTNKIEPVWTSKIPGAGPLQKMVLVKNQRNLHLLLVEWDIAHVLDQELEDHVATLPRGATASGSWWGPSIRQQRWRPQSYLELVRGKAAESRNASRRRRKLQLTTPVTYVCLFRCKWSTTASHSHISMRPTASHSQWQGPPVSYKWQVTSVELPIWARWAEETKTLVPFHDTGWFAYIFFIIIMACCDPYIIG